MKCALMIVGELFYWDQYESYMTSYKLVIDNVRFRNKTKKNADDKFTISK